VVLTTYYKDMYMYKHCLVYIISFFFLSHSELLNALLVDLTDHRKVSEVLIVIEAITNNEFIGDNEANVINVEGELNSGFFKHEGEDSDSLGLHLAKLVNEGTHGSASVDNVFKDEDFLSFKVQVLLTEDLDILGGFSVDVRLDSDVFGLDSVVVFSGQVNVVELSVEVHPHLEGTLHNNQNNIGSILVEVGDGFSHLLDLLGDLLLVNDDIRNTIFVNCLEFFGVLDLVDLFDEGVSLVLDALGVDHWNCAVGL